MVPFGQICPKLAFDECRMLIVPPGHKSLNLPPDRYDLEESYCIEPDCDCRRVMLNVTSVSQKRVEAVISFRFDAGDSDRGPYLDPLNQQGRHATALLDFVCQTVLTDPQYVQRLERHYNIAKEIVAGRLRPEAAPSAPTLLGPTVVGAGNRLEYEAEPADASVERKPFDIHRQVFDEDGEADERKVQEYIDGLMNEFADSPEAEPIFKAGRKLGWAATMMEFGFSRLGVAPASMTLAEFQEVVFEIIPRKVSVDAESAEVIVTELRAFWQFAQSRYRLSNAATILRDLDSDAVARLHDELDSRANFSMAKSLFMAGRNAGFDLTTLEGLNKFMLAYNAGLRAGERPNRPMALPSEKRDLSNFDDDSFTAEPGNRADRRAAKRPPRRETSAASRNEKTTTWPMMIPNMRMRAHREPWGERVTVDIGVTAVHPDGMSDSSRWSQRSGDHRNGEK